MNSTSDQPTTARRGLQTAGPEASRKVAMIIMAALPLGVTLFAGIALWVGAGGEDGGGLDVMVRVWIATVLVTVLGAVVAWRRMVRPLLPPTGQRAQPPSPGELRRLQTGLIVCMALIEGGALFGCVVTLVGGGALPAVSGVLLMWSALVFLWPRQGWYGLR